MQQSELDLEVADPEAGPVSGQWEFGQPPVLLRVEDAAARLGIARTKMFALVGSGEVESVLVGRLRRVPVACLEEYVLRLRMQARLTGKRDG